jgi:LacI family transcriptional regulator
MTGSVNSKDVAKLAGVSQATVSRAISNPEKVSPATREQVSQAMAVLNYVPHRTAQVLKRGKSATIGLVVSDLLNPAISYMLNEMTVALDAAGYRSTVWHAATSPHDLLRGIQERSVDGLIFTTATAGSEALQMAMALRVPVLLVNRTIEGLACDQISTDNRAGAAQVASYLVANGRTNVAFITGSRQASTAAQRETSFVHKLAELGYSFPADRIRDGGFTYEQAGMQAQSLLESDSPPNAIFCANDLMAFGALDALRRYREHSEADCWIVGFDDIPMASWSAFDLTTVRQPFPEMIQAGVEILLNRIDDPSLEPQIVEFECELIVRATTDNVPIY